MGHNNEVHYSRIHLCTGGLTCPIYSWDPNWTTCTNQASESSTKKGISFALYIFSPLQPAQTSHPPGSLTLGLDSLNSLPASVFKFKNCRYYFQLLPVLNITILFPTPVCKRFSAFWVWPLRFLLGGFLSQQESWCRNNLPLLTLVFSSVFD